MTSKEYSTLEKRGFTELMEDAKIRLLKKKLKNDFTGFKKLGVAIRTSSSLQYGWVDSFRWDTSGWAVTSLSNTWNHCCLDLSGCDREDESK